MTRIRPILTAVILTVLAAVPCQADYSITAASSSYTVNSGGTISINLFIASNNAGTPAPDLQQYTAEFVLQRTGTSSGPLIAFATVNSGGALVYKQPDGYLDTTGGTPANPSYVFGGNSVDSSNPPSTNPNIPSRSGQYNSGNHQDLILQDGTADSTGATITASNSLFAVLTISAPTSVTSNESFSLDLVNIGNTFFYTGGGAQPGYTFNGGTPITISVLGVPEPSSILLISLGLATTTVTLAMKKRKTLKSLSASA